VKSAAGPLGIVTRLAGGKSPGEEVASERQGCVRQAGADGSRFVLLSMLGVVSLCNMCEALGFVAIIKRVVVCVSSR
jgi:hypothetical protein